MTGKRSAAEWTAAVASALRNHDVKAIPGLLVLMALDGHGHEAEELRRLMLQVSAKAKP